MSWRTSPGGLVTALEPVLRANDGAWIGWPGSADTDDVEPFVEEVCRVVKAGYQNYEIVLVDDGSTD